MPWFHDSIDYVTYGLHEIDPSTLAECLSLRPQVAQLDSSGLVARWVDLVPRGWGYHWHGTVTATPTVKSGLLFTAPCAADGFSYFFATQYYPVLWLLLLLLAITSTHYFSFCYCVAATFITSTTFWTYEVTTGKKTFMKSLTLADDFSGDGSPPGHCLNDRPMYQTTQWSLSDFFLLGHSAAMAAIKILLLA